LHHKTDKLGKKTKNTTAARNYAGAVNKLNKHVFQKVSILMNAINNLSLFLKFGSDFVSLRSASSSFQSILPLTLMALFPL